MHVLLIDVGSTYIKYAVYDDTRKALLADGKAPFPEPLYRDDVRYTVRAEQILEKITDIFRTAEPYRVKRAFFSVQMHGYVLKRGDGMPRTYVSWRDRSGDPADARFRDTDFLPFGTSLKDNLPLAKIPAPDGSCEFFTLGSYLAEALTQNNAAHITDACASGFFFAEDGTPNRFSGEMKLPRVYTEVCPCGEYHGICIYTPVGDHQASFLGSGAGKDCYFVNIGTAAQVSCLADVPCAFTDCEQRPYFDKNVRLCTVSGLTGGDVLYREPEKADKLYEELLCAFERLPKKTAVLFGGGGSENAYGMIAPKLEKKGYACRPAAEQPGTEGLKIMSEQKRLRIGVMHSEIPFVNFPVIAKNEGLDFLILDSEHGAFDYAVTENLIVCANLIGEDLIVRIGDHSRASVTKLADMGAHGFLLPMTNTQEDIRELVDYAKYKPVGKRGVSTTRAHTLYNPPPLEEYIRTANERMKVYAQIETAAGMEHLQEILAVDGMDGIFIGPNDLSMDLDCVGDTEKLCACIREISACCIRAGKPFGIITGEKQLLDCAISCGASMVSVGSELNMLKNGCKKVKEMLA